MIDISVIIPIYGAEKYIERCAISLFEQTIKNNVEFIFMNDCTKDSSMDVLKKTLLNYPHRQQQVCVFSNTTNIGAGATRKIGLNRAKGKYILCVDSDDYIEKDMLEVMHNSSLNCDSDIVLSDYLLELPDRTVYKKQEPTSIDGKKCMNQVLMGQLHGSWWNKLIKRDLLERKISYPESRRDMLEDLMVTSQILYYSNKISYINRAFYHYVNGNTSSVSSSLSKDKLESMLYAYTLVNKFFKLNNIVDKDALSAKYYFRVSTLSAVVLWERKGDFSINYKRYNLLLPYVIKHPKLSISYKLALLAKITGINQSAVVLLFLRKKAKHVVKLVKLMFQYIRLNDK